MAQNQNLTSANSQKQKVCKFFFHQNLWKKEWHSLVLASTGGRSGSVLLALLSLTHRRLIGSTGVDSWNRFLHAKRELPDGLSLKTGDGSKHARNTDGTTRDETLRTHTRRIPGTRNRTDEPDDDDGTPKEKTLETRGKRHQTYDLDRCQELPHASHGSHTEQSEFWCRKTLEIRQKSDTREKMCSSAKQHTLESVDLSHWQLMRRCDSFVYVARAHKHTHTRGLTGWRAGFMSPRLSNAEKVGIVHAALKWVNLCFLIH